MWNVTVLQHTTRVLWSAICYEYVKKRHRRRCMVHASKQCVVGPTLAFNEQVVMAGPTCPQCRCSIKFSCNLDVCLMMLYVQIANVWIVISQVEWFLFIISLGITWCEVGDHAMSTLCKDHLNSSWSLPCCNYLSGGYTSNAFEWINTTFSYVVFPQREYMGW